MSLSIDQIDDYALNVLDFFVRDKYVNLTLSLQHKTAKRFFEKGGSGTGTNWHDGAELKFKVKTTTAKNARVTELYDEDRSNVVNTFVEGAVKWSMYTGNFTYDIAEQSFLGGSQTIVPYLKSNADDMFEDLWDLFETDIWNSPTSSTQSPRPLYGIPTWVVTNGATPGGAFNGGNPSGFPNGPAGIDADTYTRANNWTWAHDGIVDEQFVTRAVRAMRKTEFLSVHPYPDLVPDNIRKNYEVCTTLPMLEEYESFCRSQNDNLGKNGAAMRDGMCLLHGNVVQWVPFLEEQGRTGAGSGNDPFYLLNMNSMKFMRRKGWWMHKSKPIIGAGHNVRTVHLDCHVGSVCYDRSRMAVGSRV